MKDLLGPGGGTDKSRGGGAGWTTWTAGITSLRRASGKETAQRRRPATCDAAGVDWELPSVQRAARGDRGNGGCAAAGTSRGGLGGDLGGGRVQPCREIHPPKCSPLSSIETDWSRGWRRNVPEAILLRDTAAMAVASTPSRRGGWGLFDERSSRPRAPREGFPRPRKFAPNHHHYSRWYSIENRLLAGCRPHANT